ncbi:MAG: DUF5069 domain-containing protein [Opitutales bacterium]
MPNEKLLSLAKDLSKEAPRSPRVKLGGFVVAARTLDKCRAKLAGTLGEYHFDCPLDRIWFHSANLSSVEFMEYVETGATDEELAAWIEKETENMSQAAKVQWNNDMRYKRINEMPEPLQLFLEGYIDRYVAPTGKLVTYWFDVYDIEEGRI